MSLPLLIEKERERAGKICHVPMLIHKQTNDQWVTSQGQIEKLWVCADPEFFPGMEGGPKKNVFARKLERSEAYV